MALFLMIICAYLIVGAFGLVYSLRITDRLGLLPIVAMIANECAWHLLGGLSCFSGASPEYIQTTAIGSTLDFIYMLCWGCGFLLVYHFSKRTPKHLLYYDMLRENIANPFVHVDANYYISRLRPILLISILCVFMLFPLSKILGWPVKYAWEWEGIQVSRFPLLHILMIRVIETAPALGCTWIILVGQKLIHRRNILALLAIFGYSVVWGLAMGVRGRAIAPLVLLVLSIYVIHRKVRYLAALTLGAVLAVIIMSPVIEAMRKSNQFGMQASPIKRVKVLLSGPRSGERGLVSLRRMNIGYCTGVVYRETNRSGYVGLRPYYGVPFLLVPRLIYPNKPVYGSISNRKWDALWYQVGRWMGGASERTASQTLGVGAQPYWVAGWLGVLFMGLLGGGVIGLIWYRWRVAYHPLGLAILMAVMVTGVEFSRLYYDLSWPLKDFVQKGGILAFLYLITRLFVWWRSSAPSYSREEGVSLPDYSYMHRRAI